MSVGMVVLSVQHRTVIESASENIFDVFISIFSLRGRRFDSLHMPSSINCPRQRVSLCWQRIEINSTNSCREMVQERKQGTNFFHPICC